MRPGQRSGGGGPGLTTKVTQISTRSNDSPTKSSLLWSFARLDGHPSCTGGANLCPAHAVVRVLLATGARHAGAQEQVSAACSRAWSPRSERRPAPDMSGGSTRADDACRAAPSSGTALTASPSPAPKPASADPERRTIAHDDRGALSRLEAAGIPGPPTVTCSDVVFAPSALDTALVAGERAQTRLRPS